ncbi:MAG: decaprenyl-phosphate phosphoribosyltransferase [Actinobacteria bacterium]|nr:decaprenyl-phosphate phosphoribosyltransferase [Actinomycetota bacterium]
MTDDATPGSAPSPNDASAHKRRPLPLALVVEARPKQWAKNVLVFAAPGAAGVLGQRSALVGSAIAFVAFCMAASGTYYLNDAGDVEADRLHPKKRYRPIAAGEIPVTLARIVGGALIAGGVAVSFAAHWQLAVTVVCYVLLTTTYTVWLKHVVIFDVVAVAAGFVLRTLAGATATGVDISNWFFIVTTFGSLFMVAGKRHAEGREVGTGGATRATLADYSVSYLEYLRSVSTGVVLVAYCLWSFEKADFARAAHAQSVPWFQLSIVPFAIAILRYAYLVDRGLGGAPEEVVLSDKVLLGLGAAWALLFAIGLHTT